MINQTERQGNPLATVQATVIKWARSLQQAAPLDQVSYCVGRQDLVAQQKGVSYGGVKEGHVNLEMVPAQGPEGFPDSRVEVAKGLEITYMDSHKGWEVFSLGLADGKVTVTIFPGRGLALPPALRGPALVTKTYEILNPNYSQQELEPLNVVQAAVLDIMSPKKQWEASIRDNGWQVPPGDMPMDTTVPFVGGAVVKTADQRGSLTKWSFAETSTPEENAWASKACESMTTETALAWLLPSLGAMTERQVQLVRGEIERQRAASLSKLMKLTDKKITIQMLRDQFADYVRVCFVANAACWQESERNFRLTPDQDHQRAMESALALMLEDRKCMKELRTGEIGDSTMGYLVIQKARVKTNYDHNLREYKKSGVSLPKVGDVVFEQEREINFWEWLYQKI